MSLHARELTDTQPRETARIEQLRVENYRALKNIELPNITPLTVLLGPNGSGKSTLFDVFNFLSECFQFGLRHAWDRRGRGLLNRCKLGENTDQPPLLSHVDGSGSFLIRKLLSGETAFRRCQSGDDGSIAVYANPRLARFHASVHQKSCLNHFEESIARNHLSIRTNNDPVVREELCNRVAIIAQHGGFKFLFDFFQFFQHGFSLPGGHTLESYDPRRWSHRRRSASSKKRKSQSEKRRPVMRCFDFVDFMADKRLRNYGPAR